MLSIATRDKRWKEWGKQKADQKAWEGRFLGK